VKRSLIAVLLLTLAISLFSPAVPGVYAAANTVSNPGFEEGVMGAWQLAYGDAAVEAGNALTTQYALKLGGGSNRWNGVRQGVTLEPDHSYRLTGWVKSGAPVTFEVQNKGVVSRSLSSGSGTYEQVTVTFISVAAAADILISNSDTQLPAYLDDFELEDLGATTEKPLLPDLEVTSVSVEEASFQAGDDIHVIYKVKNVGGQKVWKFWHDSRVLVDGQVAQFGWGDLELNVGEEATMPPLTFKAPKASTETFSLKIETDINDKLYEPNETNNAKTLQYPLPAGNPAPVVTLNQSSGGTVTEAVYTVSGHVDQPSDIVVKVNGTPQGDVQSGASSFTREVTLQQGINTILVEATANGVKGSAGISVQYLPEEEPSGNRVPNGKFDDPTTDPWYVTHANHSNQEVNKVLLSVEDGMLKVDRGSTGNGHWEERLRVPVGQLSAGGEYTLRFDAKASVAKAIDITVAKDWEAAFAKWWESIGTSMQTYTYHFKAATNLDEVDLQFHIGSDPDIDLWFDNISLTETIPKPDLTLTNLEVTKENYEAGDQVALRVTVRNTGTADIASPFAVDFRVDGQSIGAKQVNAKLSKNGAVTVTSNDFIIANIEPQLQIIADSAQGVAESNESNNSITRTLRPVAVDSYQWDNVLIGGGGYVTGIIVHPTEPGLVYARTDGSGLLRLDAANKRWIPLMDSFGMEDKNLYAIDGIALDPNDPDVIYAEAGSMIWNESDPHDVLKSTDRGNTWKRTNLNKKFGANHNLRWNGEPMAVDPHNGNIVYAGTRYDGLWRSIDAAETWERVADIPGEPFSMEVNNIKGVRNVMFDPASPVVNGVTQTIYAGVFGTGVFRSVDGGTSWTLMQGSPARPNRMEFASDGTFYVSSEQGLYKYENQEWIDISPEAGENFNSLTVHPHNPKFLITTKISQAFHNPIYMSKNGGITWTVHSPAESDLHNDNLWMHKDHFSAATSSVVFDKHNPKRVYLSDWYATWITDDITAEHPQWYTMEEGHEHMVAFGLANPPSGARLLTAIADNDGMRHTDLSKFPDRSYNGMQETTGIDFSEGNPDIVARVGSNGWGENGGNGFYSTDNGVSWTPFQEYPKDSSGKKLANGRIAVSAAAENPAMVVVPINATPKYSTDMGKTWIDSEGVDAGAVWGFWTFDQPLASDRVTADTFYLYKSGIFYRSTDAGAHFVERATLPNNMQHTVKAAPGMANEVWVALDKDGLYRSSDGGDTFTKLDHVQTAFSLAFGKEADGVFNPTVYVYGKVYDSVGIFRSTDMGATWVKVTDNAHKMGTINVLGADRQTFGVVYVASGGRGYYFGTPSGVDLVSPKLYLESTPSVTRDATITIKGRVRDNAGSESIVVTVNREPVTLDGSYGFTYQATLGLGDNEITIAARDAANNESDPQTIRVSYDPDAVVIELDQRDETVVHPSYVVSGKVNTQGALTINNEAVEIANDLSFSHSLTLQSGLNELSIVMEDDRGNRATRVLRVTLDDVRPVITVDPLPGTTVDSRIRLTGKLNKPGVVKVNGRIVALKNDLTFETAVSLQGGDNEIKVIASDPYGRLAEPVTVHVNYTKPAGLESGKAKAARVNTALNIDGNTDESSWHLLNSADKVVSGNTENIVRFGAQWDDQYLYIGGKVYDRVLKKTKSAFDNDGVEVYLDMTNHKGPWVHDSDTQLALSFNDSEVTAWRKHDNVIAKSVPFEGGYSFEMKVPWATFNVTPETGDSIGFDIGNNDDDTGAGRTGILMWAGNNDNWQNTAAYGQLTLTEVQAPVVQSITVDPTSVSMTVGDKRQVAVSAAYSNGTTADVTGTATYQSSNRNVAAVSDGGLITAIGAGSAVITVSYGGKTAETAVTVAAPSSGNPGNGSGGQGPKNDQVVVNDESLKNIKDGKASVPIAGGKKEVLLPLQAASVLRGNALEVIGDHLSVIIPADILEELQALAAEAGMMDGSILLKMEAVSTEASKELLEKSKKGSHTAIRIAGEVYNFSLAVVDKNGGSKLLSKFDKPLTLKLKASANADKALSGIYYIADDGTIDYIGGVWENGYWTAEVTHFSKYAILEYEKRFDDVANSHWASGAIKALAARHMVAGVSETEFMPRKPITRAVFVAMIGRVLELKETGSVSFADVPVSHGFYREIAAAVKARIVSGRSAQSFAPNDAITREETAVLLVRAYEFKYDGKLSASGASGFRDSGRIGDWARASVAKAQTHGLMTGKGGSLFDPKATVTRAECAQVLFNLLKL